MKSSLYIWITIFSGHTLINYYGYILECIAVLVIDRSCFFYYQLKI